MCKFGNDDYCLRDWQNEKLKCKMKWFQVNDVLMVKQYKYINF